MVNPNPLGPLLIIMGGFKELINGEMSLQGDASLLEAVLDPPGLCMDWIRFLLTELFPEPSCCSSVGRGIIRLSPLALLDFTILDFSFLTRGLGISGSTDSLGLTRLGREAGPDMFRSHKPLIAKASASSSEILNLGSCSLL